MFQGEEPHQVSRFQLTRTDFPTLGSEKNPDLRPQQSKHEFLGCVAAFFAFLMCTIRRTREAELLLLLCDA